MLAQCLIALTALAAAPVATVDLARIGHVQPKGRIQDTEYNNLPVVDALISMGPSAIPFLVSQLEDEGRAEGHVFDFWPDVRVADVALVVLCDFFLAADWRTPTVPGLQWDSLLERRDQDASGAILLQEFVAKHGRAEIRRRVEKILQAHTRGFAWDEKERCFRPSK